MTETETIRFFIERGGQFHQFHLNAIGNRGNNRVYRMDAAEGVFLVKHYFQDPSDQRDRFAAEHAFYSFLWNLGIRRTPKPIQWLFEERLAIFEFIRGNKPAVADTAMICAAIDFFKELNANNDSPEANRLPEASEARFSLREHLDCVGRRVEALCVIKPGTEIDRAAVEFVNSKMAPALKSVKDRIIRATPPGELVSELSIGGRCISPSDFGFHNSLLHEDGNLRFFDFEYAGWDDPAKTICDFFCQPAVPVDHCHFDRFLTEALQIFPCSDLEKRVNLLMPLYQIKWCCIMLNEFLPSAAARRLFAAGVTEWGKLKSEQLGKAQKLFSTVETS